jgi:hypothetical protein
MKKRTKIIVYLNSLCLLLLIIFIASLMIYGCVLPYYQINRTLTDFEHACYSNNYNQIISIISRKSLLYELVEKDSAKSLVKLFNKFEKGFEIPSFAFHRIIDDNKLRSDLIGCHLFKIWKIDNKKKEFGYIIIIEENNRWKIKQYAFPDYLDY